MTDESGLVSINNKSLLFLSLFLSLPLRLLRTLASAFRDGDVSHETKIKLMTINRLRNAEYDKIVGYSTLLPLRQMKPVNRKISECHSNRLRGDLCKSGPGYFAAEKSFPSNFAQ